MSNISNVLNLASELIVKYQNAKLKSYENIRHIMRKEGEILVPNKTEEYIFRLDEEWKIVLQDKDFITIRKTK